MIKSIVFDLGGVLVDLDLKKCQETFVNVLGFTKIYELLDPCHQKGFYSDLEEGKITPDQFRTMVLRDSRPACKAEDVDRCMYSLLVGMDKSKVSLIEELAKKYELYILSNNNPISMTRCHAVFDEAGLDYRRLIKTEFISCEMKMLKPSLEIFNEVVRRIGVQPQEIMFIDDSLPNVKAAESAGLRGVHYIQGTDLKESIERALC